jgi:hypothetical protein
MRHMRASTGAPDSARPCYTLLPPNHSRSLWRRRQWNEEVSDERTITRPRRGPSDRTVERRGVIINVLDMSQLGPAKIEMDDIPAG